MTSLKTLIAAPLAGIIAAVSIAAGVGAFSSSQTPTPTRTAPSLPSHPAGTKYVKVAGVQTLTGSIDVTASKGQCQSSFRCVTLSSPFQLTSIHVDCDQATISGHSYDCLQIAAGATGCGGPTVVSTISQDAVKVTGGENVTLGGPGDNPANDCSSVGGPGSSISCTTTSNNGHQDGIQATGGTNIEFDGFTPDGCTSATNAQVYINGTSTNSADWPHNVVVTSSRLEPNPAHFHVVTVGASFASGVKDSTICPGSAPNLVYAINTSVAVDPLDKTTNTFPAHGEDGCG